MALKSRAPGCFHSLEDASVRFECIMFRHGVILLALAELIE